MIRLRCSILIGLLCISSTGVVAQTKSKRVRNLEKQRQELFKKIDGTTQKINQLQKTTKDKQQQLQLIKERVKQQAEVVGVLNQEVEVLQDKLDSLGKASDSLAQKELILKEQYSRSIIALSGRDRDLDKLLLLVSSSHLSQLQRREQLLRIYTDETKRVIGELRQIKTSLAHTHREINTTHEEKKQVLEIRDQEKKKLELEQGVRSQQIQNLQQETKELNRTLQTQKSQAEQLSRKIENQIAQEIAEAERQVRLAQERAEKRRKRREQQRQRQATASKAKTKAPITPTEEERKDREEEQEDKKNERQRTTEGGYAMNKQELALSGSFSNNRGRLPMPVRGKYIILRTFGLQSHNNHNRVQISSGGIDVQPSGDSRAYAVFDGVVSRVFVTPGYGTSIIIRHGNYLTVYANLSNAIVATGQRVHTGAVLGTIGQSNEGGGKLLHFQLWHERTKQNPLSWLRR